MKEQLSFRELIFTPEGRRGRTPKGRTGGGGECSARPVADPRDRARSAPNCFGNSVRGRGKFSRPLRISVTHLSGKTFVDLGLLANGLLGINTHGTLFGPPRLVLGSQPTRSRVGRPPNGKATRGFFEMPPDTPPVSNLGSHPEWHTLYLHGGRSDGGSGRKGDGV